MWLREKTSIGAKGDDDSSLPDSVVVLHCGWPGLHGVPVVLVSAAADDAEVSLCTRKHTTVKQESPTQPFQPNTNYY